jgi:FtsZ-binding cell division protein ZapB
MSPVPQESDSLSSLEERIQRAVKLVTRLREEKEAALADASAARAETVEARAQVDRLSDEVRTLQMERKQVRNRIERLLGQIDELNAG